MKYYPLLGVKTSQWGQHTYVGVAPGQNALGVICTTFSVLLLWQLLSIWRSKWSKAGRKELYLIAGLFLMILYCLSLIHSATATICLLLGAFTMLGLGLRFVNKRIIGAYVLLAVIGIGVAQLFFDIYGTVVELTGHESTMEGRIRLWTYLLETDTHPMLGTGFESFWLGQRAIDIRAMPGFQWAVEAHDGYIELYLNLGIVGLLIFIGVVVVAFWKICRQLSTDFEWGRFQMACLVVILLHNWSEAGFKGLSFPFLILFLVAVNYRHLRMGPEASPLEAAASEEELELVYSENNAW
jgi:O-antigen ligase